MPGLRAWRHILAHATTTALSVPDVGHRFECFPFAPGRMPAALPCALIQQGGDGPYVDLTTDGDLTTVCQGTGLFTLWVVVGDVMTEGAADLMDDLLDQIRSGALDAAATDELNPGGHVPTVETIGTPGVNEDYGGTPIFWAPVRLLVPLN